MDPSRYGPRGGGPSAPDELQPGRHGREERVVGRCEVVRRVARETAAVARAAGASSLSEEEAFAAVRDVARATGDNASSMLQDARARRPTTEIDHLNGVLMFDRLEGDQRKEALAEYRRIEEQATALDAPRQPLRRRLGLG